MIRGEITAEYRRSNWVDRFGFPRWMLVTTVVLAALIFGLFVFASVYSGSQSKSVTAQKQPTVVYVEAK